MTVVLEEIVYEHHMFYISYVKQEFSSLANEPLSGFFLLQVHQIQVQDLTS